MPARVWTIGYQMLLPVQLKATRRVYHGRRLPLAVRYGAWILYPRERTYSELSSSWRGEIGVGKGELDLGASDGTRVGVMMEGPFLPESIFEGSDKIASSLTNFGLPIMSADFDSESRPSFFLSILLHFFLRLPLLATPESSSLALWSGTRFLSGSVI